MKFTKNLVAVSRAFLSAEDRVYWDYRLAKETGRDAASLAPLTRRLLSEGWLTHASSQRALGGVPRSSYQPTPRGLALMQAVIDRAEGRAVSKRCGRCREEKPVAQFTRNASAPDGLSNACKACVRAYHLEKRARPKPALPADYSKPCTRCRRVQPAAAFVKTAVNNDGLHSWCRDCVKAYHATVKPRLRETGLMWSYNLSPAQYEALLQACDGRCSLCGGGELGGGPMEGLVVDHDHACCPGNRSCGRCVRGILCGVCNTILGRLEGRAIDPTVWAASARDYLDRYAERTTSGRDSEELLVPDCGVGV